MVEHIKHFVQFRLQTLKINKHAGFIQGPALRHDFHPPVMTVQLLAFSFIPAQVMR
jgi:hypothetical protein